MNGLPFLVKIGPQLPKACLISIAFSDQGVDVFFRIFDLAEQRVDRVGVARIHAGCGGDETFIAIAVHLVVFSGAQRITTDPEVPALKRSVPSELSTLKVIAQRGRRIWGFRLDRSDRPARHRCRSRDRYRPGHRLFFLEQFCEIHGLLLFICVRL